MTSKMEEMRVELEESNQVAEAAEKELKNAKHSYDVELSEIKRNHEKRVLFFFRTLPIPFKTGFRSEVLLIQKS